MNNDLVKRLRNHIAVVFDNKGHVFESETLCDEAADEIEKLQARVAELEDVLGALVFCEDAEFYPGAIEKSSPYCIDFEEWHEEALAELSKERSDEKGENDE